MWKKKKNNRKMAFNTETVLMAAKAPLNMVLTYFQTTSLGLTDEEVERDRDSMARTRLYTS